MLRERKAPACHCGAGTEMALEGSLLPGVPGSGQSSWSIGSWLVIITIQHQPLVPGKHTMV